MDELSIFKCPSVCYYIIRSYTVLVIVITPQTTRVAQNMPRLRVRLFPRNYKRQIAHIVEAFICTKKINRICIQDIKRIQTFLYPLRLPTISRASQSDESDVHTFLLLHKRQYELNRKHKISFMLTYNLEYYYAQYFFL